MGIEVLRFRMGIRFQTETTMEDLLRKGVGGSVLLREEDHGETVVNSVRRGMISTLPSVPGS